MVVLTGVLFTLLGCPSASASRVFLPTERTRTFTEMDKDYFFVYMVVLPGDAPAPQSKAAITDYPNVKKRSMSLSRLRSALDSEASVERVYYADADVVVTLVGHRYVVVHPTTVNPPKDAFDGLTMFYMPGGKDLEYLQKETATTTVKDVNGEDLRVWDAEEVFLNPGKNYKLYWLADYYSEGNEKINSLSFTTHALEAPTHTLVSEEGLVDPEDPSSGVETRYKFVTKTGEPSRDTVGVGVGVGDNNVLFVIETLYTNASGPLQHASDAVGNRIMFRVGEPAFFSSEIRLREPDPKTITLLYINDTSGHTLFVENKGKALLLGPEYASVATDANGDPTTIPFLVSGTPSSVGSLDAEWFIPLSKGAARNAFSTTAWYSSYGYKFSFWMNSVEFSITRPLGRTMIGRTKSPDDTYFR